MSGTQAVFSQVLAKTLPMEMEYTLPKEAVYSERQTTRFEPAGGYASYLPESTCRINIPPIDAFMDTHATHLKFKVTTPNSIFRSSGAGAHGFLRHVRVYHSSGALIDEIQNYNLLMATQASVTVPEDLRAGPLQISQGLGGVELFSGRTFMVPIKNMFFSNLKHLPVKYLGGITLEIVWARASTALVNSQVDNNVTQTYTISDVSLVTSIVKPSDVQIAEYDSMFRQRGLRLYGQGYKHYFLNWATQNATLTIADRSASVKDITVVFRDLSGQSSTTYDKLISRVDRVASYQWSCAGRLFPNRPITDDIEAFSELMDATHGNVQGWRMTRDLWSNTADGSFVIMREMESSRSLVSGDRTSRDKQVDLQLIIQGTQANPSVLTDAFIHHDKVVEFSPTGTVSIYE